MPKRREPKASSAIVKKSKPSAKQIEAFVSAGEPLIEVKAKELASNASRNFKAIRVPFNEYEFVQLEKASQTTGRTKLNFIRYAILKLAKEVQPSD